MTGFPRVVADWDRLAERARWMPAAVAECEAVREEIGELAVVDANRLGYTVEVFGGPTLFFRWGQLRPIEETAS